MAFPLYLAGWVLIPKKERTWPSPTACSPTPPWPARERGGDDPGRLLVTPAPETGGRRRAKRVLALAGVVALLGLVGGALASPRLTSSLSDYDAPGSAVVWPSTNSSGPRGPTPKRVTRSSSARRRPSAWPRRCRPGWPPSSPSCGPAPEVRQRPRLRHHRGPVHDLPGRDPHGGGGHGRCRRRAEGRDRAGERHRRPSVVDG